MSVRDVITVATYARAVSRAAGRRSLNKPKASLRQALSNVASRIVSVSASSIGRLAASLGPSSLARPYTASSTLIAGSIAGSHSSAVLSSARRQIASQTPRVRSSIPSLHRSVGPEADGRGLPGPPLLLLPAAGRGVPARRSLWQRLADLNARLEASWLGDLLGLLCLIGFFWLVMLLPLVLQ
jgi:hypothetical protein